MEPILRHDKLRGICERIVNAILDDAILDKPRLIERVRTLLRIHTMIETRPKNYENIKSEKGQLVRTIEQKDIEQAYWYGVFKDLVPESKRKRYTDELDNILIESGHKKINP